MVVASTKTIECQTSETGIAYAVMVDGDVYKKLDTWEQAKLIQHVYNDAVCATISKQKD
ncbi:MAG: hypothetical protein GY749_22805 [Desulfobacteraceae bacterium]|nr:hypothetical protein [Desulfobacteraceae bacterium]